MNLNFILGILLSFFCITTHAQDLDNNLKRSRGNSFNPDISINGLFLYQNSNRGNAPDADPQNGFSLQEAEIQFTADVDPYSRLMALFSVHPELETNTAPAQTEYHFAPEEIYAESLALPHLTLKAGKFKAAFGRHNLLHTHAFPFIDAPLIQSQLLGDEGFNDTGASISGLLPLPWFSEVTAQILSGRSEGLDHFHNPSPNSSATLLHYKNLWELSEATTLQWGLSATQGKNNFERQTDLLGTDLTLKWRPTLFGSSRSLNWSTEWISRTQRRTDSQEKGQGVVTALQYQGSSRWWFQARTEYLELQDNDPLNTVRDFYRKHSALLAYVPSEFSSFRLQYDRVLDPQEDPENKISLQLNFSIGAHPSHLY